MYHQIHLLDLYPTLARLRYLVDEECAHPNAVTLDLALLLQRYLKSLVMNEFVPGYRIRDVLAPLIKCDRFGLPTPEALSTAADIEDQIHDELLMITRVFLTLDESEQVIEILVANNGDTQIIVEEREVLRWMAENQSDREYGQCDVEEHALQKMMY